MDDLDRLVSELESRVEMRPVGSRLDGWLQLVAERDASDLVERLRLAREQEQVVAPV